MRLDLVSPKQVARALGVSESSVKRWCDQNLIATVRTAGGHRKMALTEVMRYIREHDFPIVSPELLGLPPVAQLTQSGLERGQQLIVEALLAGNESLVRQILVELYLAKHTLSTICDTVIAQAFRVIGERWACREVDVYEERRGCEAALRVVYDLRRMLPEPTTPWVAMGGTPEGDAYVIPSSLAELVLCEVGYRTLPLGISLPFNSLIKAVDDSKPKLFWLSVSYIHNVPEFIAGFRALAQACVTTNTALVVGGRAFTEEIRQQLIYSAYCDTMQQLATFAQTLLRSANRNNLDRRIKTNVKQRKSRIN